MKINLFFVLLLFVLASCQQELPITSPTATAQPNPQPQPTQPIIANPIATSQPNPQPQPIEPIITAPEPTAIASQYAVADGGLEGWLHTGQAADLMLSGPGFNQTGGPLLFNHPGQIATDGSHLLLADRNNNRVLIWNQLPDDNVPPDFVLGQPDFDSNNPGTGPNQMNWPVALSVGGGKLVVADSYNNRVLIWLTFPTQNGQPADLILQTPISEGVPQFRIEWPWGVWTDGNRLAITSTMGQSAVLLWNTFPSQANQAPDLTLTAGGQFGTPRGITSNGQYLLVGDHNPRFEQQPTTQPIAQNVTFGWTSWPSSDQPADFTLDGWLQGSFSEDGKLLMAPTTGYTISIWDALPTASRPEPDWLLGEDNGYSFLSGDGSGVAVASGRVYISLSNGNKIVAYRTMPTQANQLPDFAIGAPDIATNTLDTHFIISNPVVASNGTALFASSDFDRRLYVWQQLPDESNAKPDWVYSLPSAPWDNALWGNSLILAGQHSIMGWTTALPVDGQPADWLVQGELGGIRFQDLKGVALDDRYFYLADQQADAIYVWEGLPTDNEAPAFTLNVEAPGRLASDGQYLTMVFGGGSTVGILEVAELGADSVPAGISNQANQPRLFNLPAYAMTVDGRLLIADTGSNRILIWNEIANALAYRPADIVLGAADLQDLTPEIGADKLFWPASLAFDGSYLWVGEFKFSERILRFSIQP